MKSNKLDHFEIENIEDCLGFFEKDFNIKFENNETEKVSNFDEFCDLAISKINLENIETCTTQQAFYKFRNSLKENNFNISEKINPESELKNIFPRKNRIQSIKQIEKSMGFKFEILNPPQYIINIFVILFGLSIFGLFFFWKIAIFGIMISILGFYSFKFTKRLEIKTVRGLIEKITALNYLAIRNQKNTVNKSELKTVIINWFSENAGIEREKLKLGVF